MRLILQGDCGCTDRKRAAAGVCVRVISDAKDSTDQEHNERYKTMRLLIEKMVRGKDSQLKSDDDISVFSDASIFAVEDSAKRIALFPYLG